MTFDSDGLGESSRLSTKRTVFQSLCMAIPPGVGSNQSATPRHALPCRGRVEGAMAFPYRQQRRWAAVARTVLVAQTWCRRAWQRLQPHGSRSPSISSDCCASCIRSRRVTPSTFRSLPWASSIFRTGEPPAALKVREHPRDGRSVGRWSCDSCLHGGSSPGSGTSWAPPDAESSGGVAYVVPSLNHKRPGQSVLSTTAIRHHPYGASSTSIEPRPRGARPSSSTQRTSRDADAPP